MLCSADAVELRQRCYELRKQVMSRRTGDYHELWNSDWNCEQCWICCRHPVGTVHSQVFIGHIVRRKSRSVRRKSKIGARHSRCVFMLLFNVVEISCGNFDGSRSRVDRTVVAMSGTGAFTELLTFTFTTVDFAIAVRGLASCYCTRCIRLRSCLFV